MEGRAEGQRAPPIPAGTDAFQQIFEQLAAPNGGFGTFRPPMFSTRDDDDDGRREYSGMYS